MNKMILLVDDNVDLIEYLMEILTELNLDMELLTAHTGNEARKLIEESHKTITIIFLDVVLPDDNGFEIYDYIRGFSKEIKIVIMSAYPLADMMVEKMYFFFKKPFSMSDIDVLMEQLNQ